MPRTDYSRNYTPITLTARESAELERVRAAAINSECGDDKLAKMLGVTIHAVNAACLGVRIAKRKCPGCERKVAMPCVECAAREWRKKNYNLANAEAV